MVSDVQSINPTEDSEENSYQFVYDSIVLYMEVGFRFRNTFVVYSIANSYRRNQDLGRGPFFYCKITTVTVS